MGTKKFREIKIRPAVTLPALNTDNPERKHGFLAFLRTRVVAAPGLRKDENLPHRFEWEDTLDAFEAGVRADAGLEEPAMPDSALKSLPAGATDKDRAAAVASDMEAQTAYVDEVRAYIEALETAAEGGCIYVSDEAFAAGADAAKDSLDADLTPSPMTRRQELPEQWAGKVLRHYHALRQSRAVEERDIPKPASKADGVQTRAS